MADAVVSVVAERIIGLLEEQARYHVNLVRGAEKEVVILAKELKTVRNVLDDAERRGFKEESIRDWLVRLEQTSYKMEDILDEWDYAILKLQIENHGPEDDVVDASKKKVWSCVPSSPCLCFKKVVVRHHIASKILDVKEQLDDILREKEKYNFVMSQPTVDSLPRAWRVQSNSSVELEKVHGRDFDRDNIVSKLVVNNDGNIVSVVGVGGLGKTTLAQLVYNDNRVKECFELRIWICVSDPFDEVGIAKRIVESVNKESFPNTDQLEVALQCLREAISGKKFLLVLDDVWNEDSSKWEPLRINLKCGGGGCKILVTTRNEKVARMMDTYKNDIYRPQELSPEECWSLMRRICLFGRSEEDCKKFQEVGKKIASKCKGLPLAATVLGGLLKFKNSLEEWENVLVSEIWQLEEVEVQLFPHLLLTYNELSPILKRCFSYCAIFPKDFEIDVDELIGHWIAQGYLGSDVGNGGDMEHKGREYFNNLAMRSLFLDLKNSELKLDPTSKVCKMHDIVHDFAQSLRRKDRSCVRVEAKMKNPTCDCCVQTYRSLLFNHSNRKVCDCFTSLRVLSMRGIHDKDEIPTETEQLIRFWWLDFARIPREIEQLIHLRWLDLPRILLSSEDVKTICKLYSLQFLRLQGCSPGEVPTEIGNLINLRYLDVSWNTFLKELPESICDLHELRALDITLCDGLSKLPEAINSLINLKHLFNMFSEISHFPQALGQLINLRSLNEFMGGKGLAKFGLLKNLNNLSGLLSLNIVLSDESEDMAEDVREADLRNKMHLLTLRICFLDEMDEKNDLVRMNVMDALKPHPNLQNLHLCNYAGSKLEGWITSPLCQLRLIKLECLDRMPSLPSLGKLPGLEEIVIEEMRGLKFVGREFLGITGESSSSSSSSNAVIGFPKLKKLTFTRCYDWEEWEDITVEVEASASFMFMPCLEELSIHACHALPILPRRLLGTKALSLEYVKISDSYKLDNHYENMEGTWLDLRESVLKVQLCSK